MFDNADAIAGGNSVWYNENATLDLENQVVTLAAKATFARRGLPQVYAAETKLSVTAGTATITFGSNGLGTQSVQVVINAAAKTYTIQEYTTKLKTGTLDSTEDVVVSIVVNGDVAAVTVNGEAYAAKITNATVLENVTANFKEVQFRTLDASEASVEYITVVTPGKTETESTDVTVTSNPLIVSETVYAVDIEFGDFDFVYTPASDGEWNPDTLQYENASEGGWDKTSDTVTVTNRSNASVWVTATYAAVTEGDTLFALSGDAVSTVELVSAVGQETAPSTTVTGTVSGEPTFTGTQKIGTITVTITATNPNA